MYRGRTSLASLIYTETIDGCLRRIRTVERLRFRIDHNETVASDISEVLSRSHLPRVQCAVRRQMTPQYLDLQLRQSDDAEQLPSRKCTAISAYRSGDA